MFKTTTGSKKKKKITEYVPSIVGTTIGLGAVIGGGAALAVHLKQKRGLSASADGNENALNSSRSTIDYCKVCKVYVDQETAIRSRYRQTCSNRLVNKKEAATH